MTTMTPMSVEDVAESVQRLEAEGAALVPVGGGTQLQTGYPPSSERPYALLLTQRLDHILDYQPDDMTITCEPGVTLSALQAHLATHRQFLPIDAPLPAQATMGGIVSVNQGGFRRASYGTSRDLVIGVRAIMTGGMQVKGGGKVVKNVAGYDVCKLFTGAWGTVGILTEITFKLYPLPEGQRLLWMPAPDVATAARAGLALHHAQLAPTALIATNEFDGKAGLLALLQGPSARMAWQTGEIGRMAGEAGLNAPDALPPGALNGLRDRQARLGPDTPAAGRIACLPTDTALLLNKLQTLPGVSLTADCALGIVHFAARQPDAAFFQTVTSAAPAEANLLWTRLDPAPADRADVSRALQALNVWGDTREGAALQRALKRSIDPKNTFSPGRFAGNL
jgi:glycolate oxidase FAD binding subunit